MGMCVTAILAHDEVCSLALILVQLLDHCPIYLLVVVSMRLVLSRKSKAVSYSSKCVQPHQRVAAACVGRRELMAGEVSPVHIPRSLSSGSRFLLVAGQCEMIVSCLSSYSSFDFFNGVCCRQVKPLRTSLLLFSTTLITIPTAISGSGRCLRIVLPA